MKQINTYVNSVVTGHFLHWEGIVDIVRLVGMILSMRTPENTDVSSVEISHFLPLVEIVKRVVTVIMSIFDRIRKGVNE